MLIKNTSFIPPDRFKAGRKKKGKRNPEEI
jgi:hypothetical protein